MAEISSSVHRPLRRTDVVNGTIAALSSNDLIPQGTPIISTWHHYLEYGYPTPFLGRDNVLDKIHSELARFNIYSRGRFGGWKFEVSDQDHSAMQGVELVNKILLGVPEVTYWYPNVVNDRRYASGR